jgi:hypothetical protein
MFHQCIKETFPLAPPLISCVGQASAFHTECSRYETLGRLAHRRLFMLMFGLVP